MTATIKLFVSGLAGAGLTYAAGHLALLTSNPFIAGVLGAALAAGLHALPSALTPPAGTIAVR